MKNINSFNLMDKIITESFNKARDKVKNRITGHHYRKLGPLFVDIEVVIYSQIFALIVEQIDSK